MTREISQDNASEEHIASNFFTLRLISAVFFLTSTSIVVFFLPYASDVRTGVALASPAYVLLSLSQVCMGIFQKYLALHKAAIAEVAGRAGQLALVWMFVQKGAGLHAFLTAVVGGAVLIFLVNIFFVRHIIPIRLRWDIPYWKQVIPTAIPVAASIIFTLLYFKTDTIMLSLMRPQEEVGIYGAAYKVLETLAFFPAMFVGIMLPILSRVSLRKEEFIQVFQGAFRVLSMAALPVMIGGALTSATIIDIIAGNEFRAAAEPLRILFMAVGVIFLGNLAGQSAVALGLQKKAMWIYCGGMLVNIGANFLIIPQFSYMGAAWTTLATEAGVTLGLFMLIRQASGAGPDLRGIARSFAAAFLLGVAVYVLAQPLGAPQTPLLFVSIVLLGAALYFALLFIFGAVSKKEVQILFLNNKQ